MSSLFQIPIFYINLDTAVSRRNWFEAQLKSLGLDGVRISAINGRQLDPESLVRLKAAVKSNTKLGPAEIGCFLSHREAWKKVTESDSPWCFVSEDDLHLASQSTDYFRSLDWIPVDAAIVKPETTFRHCHLGSEILKTPDGRQMRRLHSLHGGAGGYFLSKESAKELFALTETLCEPADHILFNPIFGFSSSHVLYQIDPAFAVQDLLRREKNAGFEQSGLASERKKVSERNLVDKLIRESIRPLRQFQNYVHNTYYRIINKSTYKFIDYDMRDD